MLDHVTGQNPLSLAELHHRRMEAMRLFEKCLTSGDEAELVKFIEQQLALKPPQLHLLQEIGDDLHLRLLSLREHHFDVRDRVVATLVESYEVDITPLAPANQLERYHELSVDAVVEFIAQHITDLAPDELLMLRKMVEVSLEMAQQLHDDITITQQLHTMVIDWFKAMSSTIMRQQWPKHDTTGKSGGPIQH
ncbi:MAG: hypothetical protein K8S97_10575 [Anaerolineae bacterium]|nr:hypothetical protein [Anaerolineae bacterium]